MTERRMQHRLTTSDLVLIGWQDGLASVKQLGNVCDVSLGGIGILVSDAIAVGTPVTISYGDGDLRGVVKHRSEQIDGIFVGVEFDEASKNSTLHFQPELLIKEA